MMKRGCQQNDSLANGYNHPVFPTQPMQPIEQPAAEPAGVFCGQHPRPWNEPRSAMSRDESVYGRIAGRAADRGSFTRPAWPARRDLCIKRGRDLTRNRAVKSPDSMGLQMARVKRVCEPCRSVPHPSAPLPSALCPLPPCTSALRPPSSALCPLPSGQRAEGPCSAPSPARSTPSGAQAGPPSLHPSPGRTHLIGRGRAHGNVRRLVYLSAPLCCALLPPPPRILSPALLRSGGGSDADRISHSGLRQHHIKDRQASLL